MDKPIAALEITNNAVKLVVGYVLDDKVDILYATTKPSLNTVVDGKIVDVDGLANIISSLSSIHDDNSRLKISIAEVVVGLPPIGLEVYQNNKITNVVNADGKISRIDISNVVSLVKKEDIKQSEKIVDIVPDVFILDQGRMYIAPPIGETSNSLTINAKVHTLPRHVIDSYREAVEKAHMRVSRLVVSPHAMSELLANYKDIPSSYILLDMGAGMTSISLIGDLKLYCSTYFAKGANDLTNRIASKMKISFEEACSIKELYGIDDSELEVKVPIISGHDEAGKIKDYYLSDLNEVIVEYLEDYVKEIKLGINALLNEYNDDVYHRLPIIVVGGGSRLKGLLPVLKTKFANHQLVKIVVPTSLGARNQIYFNALALIKAASVYRGTLEDDRIRVSPVDRANQNEAKPYSELEDEL